MQETKSGIAEYIPQIDEFLAQSEAAQQSVEEYQLILKALANQVTDANRSLGNAEGRRKAELRKWLESVPLMHPLYSASYFLGNEPRDTAEQIKTLHERGLWLFKLSEICDVVPQPVLALHEDASYITVKRKGYAQGAGPKERYARFTATLGVTATTEPLHLRYDDVVDASTGVRTITPRSLDLALDDVTTINSSVGGWNYSDGEETWLNDPTVEFDSKRNIRMLEKQNDHALWRISSKLVVEAESGSEIGLDILSDHNVYVGTGPIGRAVNSLKTKHGNTRHDESAVERILEEVHRIL